MMCGITGLVKFNGEAVALETLKTMNQAIAHRGPDGDGFFCEGNVGLAHRRLAIIDPLGGVQPFYNDDRSIILSFNGEVYNYVEIQKELEPEYHFSTHSDTEVVLRAYEKWGIAALERFRGMFAFALYDKKKHLLFLVRDRVGIKPLFYHHTPGALLFASEIQPILRAGIPREVVPGSLGSYLRYQYVPAPETIYKDLHKLEPGHYLEIDTQSGVVKEQRYWHLVVDILDRPEGEWLEELNALLDDTLRLYVRSDVPFGAFLSGGLDSSLVTALMARQLEQPVRTFSIGFKEEEHSELPFAAQASRTIGTNHYEKVVSPDLAEEILGDLAVHFGEPFGDSSAIPTYYVAREAASQVKMVLSGDGGDELFGGYNSYRATFEAMSRPGKRLPAALFKLVARAHIPPALRGRPEAGRIAALQAQHDTQRQAFNDASLRALLLPDMAIAHPTPFDVEIRSRDLDPVTWFQAQDFKTYMVDDVLTKVDRMSMASSLEVRVPLLDHKVVELAFSLPLDLKLRMDETTRQLETKYLLKQSARRFYPQDFLDRPKRGFGIPVVEWCQGALKPLIEAGLRDPKNPLFDWVRFGVVQEMLNEFFAGRSGHVARLWYLFSLDMWMKHVHQAA
jgi:asparagine synthase (glutamine-hydrolysing)